MAKNKEQEILVETAYVVDMRRQSTAFFQEPSQHLALSRVRNKWSFGSDRLQIAQLFNAAAVLKICGHMYTDELLYFYIAKTLVGPARYEYDRITPHELAELLIPFFKVCPKLTIELVCNLSAELFRQTLVEQLAARKIPEVTVNTLEI